MDREICDRMRSENLEQFQTLVRMHLSFELDLNTDPVDNDSSIFHIHCSVSNVKLRSRKLFAFPKKSKQLQSISKSPPFNVVDALTPVGIEQIKQMIAFLMQDQNIIQEGIFRRTGSVARQNDLRRQLNEQNTIDFSSGVYTVHDCASVLKAIIADLPEPLLTDYFYSAHCQIAEIHNSNQAENSKTKEARVLHSIQLLLLLLPSENRSLLQLLINMLNETTKYESSNKMSSESLATLFTPHLICPRKLSPEALHSISQNLSGLISFMIGKGEELQDIPTKLATDIYAYFVEQRRKKVLSPELQILDESVTSDSTVNTVYTFVDREKTAEAHNSNPTDTALAQLYAYIQTLPESSKKRKLIKQFNKENGQGTPLQQQMMMRLKKGSSSRPNKSLSGSIKKHIFHSALGSKTPKRGSAAASSSDTMEIRTPVSARVLEAVPKSHSLLETPVMNTTETAATESCDSICETPNVAKQTNHERSASFDIQHNFINNIKHNEKIKVNKFMMCFKSEPDLSRFLRGNEGAPNLSQGRFISKNILGGVSMMNLRRSSINANDQSTNFKSIKEISNDEQSCDCIQIPPKLKTDINEALPLNSMEDKIDDDDDDFVDDEEVDREYDDSIDKENRSPLKSKHLEYISKVQAHPAATAVNCDVALLNSTNDSVSPITKSTHRMSKAMQESIMTPRSRKPVVIGGMRGLSTDNYHKKFIKCGMDDEMVQTFDCRNSSPDLHRSKSESSLLSKSPVIFQHQSIVGQESNVSLKSNSDDALSTPFRRYLFSRSLLMATPVDTSFASQSDDFENMDNSELSESLIYCLNGNDPIEMNLSNVKETGTPRTNKRILSSGSSACKEDSFSLKRPMKNEEDLISISEADKLYGDYPFINTKKNHLELDETAL